MDLQLPKRQALASFAPQGSKMQHSLFEVILLVIVGVVFFMFMIQPKRSEVSSLGQELAKLEDQKNSVQKNKATLVSLITKLQNSSKQVTELDEALPLQGRITRYRIAIESLVNNAGMTVGDISIEYPQNGIIAGDKTTLTSPFAKTRKLQKFTTSITVGGTFTQFVGLLKSLENSGRIIDITGIGINAAGEDIVGFRITTQSYFYE